MRLTREGAARVALHFQQLSQPRPKASHNAVLDVSRKLGSIQLDTISVVERTQHLVLYSRLEDYQTRLLNDLLEKQRSLTDYWTNVAAIIPTSDYKYYHYCWNAHRKGWHWVSPDFLQKVREQAPKDRPFSTDDFEESMQGRRKQIWSGSALSNALDVLTFEGFLTIHHREGFRKFYALTKPPPRRLQASARNDREVARFLLSRSLRSMGVGTLREIQVARLMPAAKYKEEVQSMMKDGTLEILRVDGLEDDYYLLSEQKQEIEAAAQESPQNSQATLLSPFDNLIINRQRTFNLFNYYHQFEAYVPKSKRKHGYYTMPILYEQNFIGYIDPKLDRKTDTMTFQSLNLTTKPSEEITEALKGEFIRFMHLHNAKKLIVRTSEPKTFRSKITTEVNREVSA